VNQDGELVSSPDTIFGDGYDDERRKRDMINRYVMAVFLGLSMLLAAGPTFAAPREATIEILRTLASGREDDSVRVVVNGGDRQPLKIGDELVYQFDSSLPGYLTAIHVDTHGSTTLLYPRTDTEAGRVNADRSVLLPGAGDGFSLTVQPPVGLDVVYAIVTDTPVTRADLGIASSDIAVSFEPHQAAGMLRQLLDVVASRPSNTVRIGHVDQKVDGRGRVLYRSADIVGFFGERTRSIRPAKLDLQVQFAIDSAELDEEARLNVDEFARALSDPKLREMRFKVSGHTDDLGSEGHNLNLSRQRARTVREYLVENGGIDESRLEIEAYGEAIPLMNDESDYARQMNRRVEFTPVR
jgi:outer membrane protein OmpA-like peptidoglycan-associated protein